MTRIHWVLIAAIVLIGGWVVASMSGKANEQQQIIEERASAVIAALERYRSEQGAYPDALAPLAPRYLAELPRCSDNDSIPMPYFLEKDAKAFQIICPLGMFGKRGFSSRTGAWSTFD